MFTSSNRTKKVYKVKSAIATYRWQLLSPLPETRWGWFMLAPPLEYKWGSQRFLTFYMMTAWVRRSSTAVPTCGNTSSCAECWSARRAEFDEVLLNGTDLWTQRPATIPTGAWPRALNALFNIPMVGASGAIYGVMLAFGLTFPNVVVIMFPISSPSRRSTSCRSWAGTRYTTPCKTTPTTTWRTWRTWAAWWSASASSACGGTGLFYPGAVVDGLSL